MEKFAVLGCGVVGSGVVELFEKNKALIEKRCGKELEMSYILDLRDFPDRPYANKLVKSLDVILADPDVRVVAECMGDGNNQEYIAPCLSQICCQHGSISNVIA